MRLTTGSTGRDTTPTFTEAWYLPAANNIPADYATEGTWYGFFKAKAKSKFGATWGTGFATFQYPNANRAWTIWYHDHTLGMTRLRDRNPSTGHRCTHGFSAPRSAQALDEALQAVRELIAHPLAKRTQIVDGLAATLASLFQRLAGVRAQRLELLELALQLRTHGV